MSILQKQLENFGLTEVQAKIYLAILNQKKITVLEIARKTGIQRPTIYDNITTLEELSLISKIVDKGRSFIIPNDPKNLHYAISKKELIAKDILPDLEKIYQTEEIKRPTVRFFHGEEGLQKLTEVILEAKEKEIRTLADYEENIKNPFSERFLVQLWEARSRKNIKAKVLYTHRSKELLLKDKSYGEIGNIRYNREVRLLPEAIDFKVLYTIADDNVLFWSSKKEDFSFQFASLSYSDSLKSLFDYLWSVSSPFNK